MKKINSVLISLMLMPLIGLAKPGKGGKSHICEFDNWREKNPTFCETQVKRIFGIKYKSYTPSPTFLNMVGGQKKYNKMFSARNAYEGNPKGKNIIGSFNKLYQQKEREARSSKNQFTKNRAKASLNQINADQIRARVQALQKNINEGGGLQSALNRLKTTKGKDAFNYTNLLESDGHPSAACMREPECARRQLELLDFQEAEIRANKNLARKQQTAANAALRANQDLARQVAKAHSHEFRQAAINKVKKADSSVVDENNDLGSACLKASKNPNSQAKKVCSNLLKDVANVNLAKQKLRQARGQIQNAQSDLELISMRLDLEDLDNEKKKIAIASLQQDINGKLEGTVLGNILDQMRADMCATALNPKIICQENASLPKSFVNDVSAVTKEQFGKRIINRGAASSSQSEN